MTNKRKLIRTKAYTSTIKEVQEKVCHQTGSISFPTASVIAKNNLIDNPCLVYRFRDNVHNLTGSCDSHVYVNNEAFAFFEDYIKKCFPEVPIKNDRPIQSYISALIIHVFLNS